MRGEYMPVAALIFDLDGTLVDTAPDLMAATNHVLSLLGRRAITMVEVRSFVGHGARALITRGCAATGAAVNEAEMDRLFEAFIAYYTANIATDSQVFPGVIALLERCQKARIKTGVCTNKLEGLSVRLLNEIGLAPYFGSIVGPDTIGIAKPDPAPYFEAVRRLGVSSADTIMFGDSETDILTARAAGVPVIAVPFGYTPEPIATYHPDHLVQHYDEIWPLLERHYFS
jgi:phosphoglycolate phosphatase